MKIRQYNYCLLQATCSMLLIAANTYATSPDSRQQQQQAEVGVPPKPVKFGEKLAPNQDYLPTPLPQQSLQSDAGESAVRRQGRRQQAVSGGVGHDIIVDPPAPQRKSQTSRGTVKASYSATEPTQRQEAQSQRSPQPRTQQNLPTPSPPNKRRQPVIEEHISLPTHPPPGNSHLSRRHNAGSSAQNHLVVQQQYEVPVVQKSHEATELYKPITSVVGQQRQQQQQSKQKPPPPPPNANRSRFSNANAEQPAAAVAASRSHTKQRQQQQQQLTAVATTKRPKSPPQQQQSSVRTISHRNSPHSTTPSSPPRNSHHNALGNRRNDKSSYQTSAADGGGRFPQKSAQQRSPPAPAPPQSNQSSRSNTGKSSRNAAATTTPRPLFYLPNEYNIFSPEFWTFLNPTTRAPRPTKTTTRTTTTTTTTTTKKPPKKYIPPQQALPKEEKINYAKAKTATLQPAKPVHVPESKDKDAANKRDDGPFHIALPTFNILNPKRESVTQSDKDKRDVEEDKDLRAKFNCPRESEVRFQLFPKICKVDDDCRVWNRGEICCEIFGAKSCVSGIPKPLEETSHSPILGLIPRKCPDRPLAELWWEVKECETDMDCWPRVCCPDGRRRYCRTSQPELNTVPVPVQRSFNYLTEYLECTAPPPPIFDLHPKACTSTLDCFPNVCCQEAGLRHCRPPKKSVLTMLANVFNVDLVKRLTQNIVIK